MIQRFTKCSSGPNLASLFRTTGAGPRTPAPPPSAFPRGLQPVASEDLNAQLIANRRTSRINIDFEQALLNGDTVKLMEGRDFNTMGVVSSPSPSSKHALSPATPTNPSEQLRLQPATPNVVPPTPSVAPSASGAASPNPERPPSPTGSSSSHEFFIDTADPGYQTKRRSMFRSPGTSSSPDLATLVRKAKERSANTNAPDQKTGTARKDSLMTSRPSTSSQLSSTVNGRTRQRSQTTVNPEQSNAQTVPPSPSIRSRLTKGRNPSTNKLNGSNSSKPDGRSASRSRSDTTTSKVTQMFLSFPSQHLAHDCAGQIFRQSKNQCVLGKIDGHSTGNGEFVNPSNLPV